MNMTDRSKMERKMTIEKAIICLKGIQENLGYQCIDMAIRSLEMQKELAEYSGMDICQFVEYDYKENNLSEYVYEDSVDNFLIDEIKEEVEKNDKEVD